MDLVKLMEGKSASRSSIIAAVKARAAAAKLTLQYLEREKEEMLKLSRLKCEQEAEEAKARCKAQMETYGISHPVDLTVVSREDSYPACHFVSIASVPSCDELIPVSPDISCDSAISSSCLSKPVSQTPVVHDSFSVPPIFFNGQGNQFHCNSFETVSNFGDFHSISNGNFSVNPMSSHDVQDHPISQLNLVYSENFGPISSTHVSRNYPPGSSHFVTPSSGPSADDSTRLPGFVCSAQSFASVYDNSACNQNPSYITSPNLASDVFCNPALTVHPGSSPSPVVSDMSDPRLSEFVVPVENDDDIACDIANNCKQEKLDSKPCSVFSHTNDTSRSNISIESSSRPSCFLCSQSHLLDCCPEFLQLSVENRFSFAFQNWLCYSCLQSNHLTKFCPKRSICSICQHSHPTSLHRGKPRNNTEQPKKLVVQPVTVETDCREVDVPVKLPAGDPVVEISCLDSDSSDDDKCGITVPVSVSSELLSTKYEKSVYCLLERSSDPSFISGVCTDTESLSESSVVHRTIVKQTQPPVIDMEKGEYLETPLLFSDREESEMLKCDSPIDIVDCDQHGYMEKPLICNHFEKVAISCPFAQLTSTTEVHVPFQSDMTFTCMTFDDPLTLHNFEVELAFVLFCFLWYLVQHRKRTKSGIIYK